MTPIATSEDAAKTMLIMTRRTFLKATGEGSLEKAAQNIKHSAASALQNAKSFPQSLVRSLPGPAKQWAEALAQQEPGSLHRVLSLQAEAFWQQNAIKLTVTAGALSAFAIWKVYLKVAGVFADVSDTLTATKLFGLSIVTVVASGLFLQSRRRIDPERVYRLAMIRLNTHPGLLEVLGAPLAGSEVRASVTTGGRLRFKGIRPKYSSRRLQMIFPLRGSDCRGLVSLEVKKRHGVMNFKLLAVDVPSITGGEQRIFLEGGPAKYDAVGVLNELRQPFVQALSLQDVNDVEDDADDDLEESTTTAPKEKGSLHFHEKLYFGAQAKLNSLLQQR